MPIKKAKILCVICTFVHEGQTERFCVESYKTGKDVGIHIENKLQSILFTLSCHEHYKPGIEYDILIVDNNSPDDEWYKIFNELKYMKARRENIGFSFGAFKWAFENYKGYDYYLFCEQDIVPTKNGWLKEIVIEFNKGWGVVGNKLESFSKIELSELNFPEDYFPLSKTIDRGASLDGNWSFTSSKILTEVYDNWVVAPIEGSGDRNCNAFHNEIAFMLPIVCADYLMYGFDDGFHRAYHGVKFTEPLHPKKPLTPLVLGHTRFYDERKHFNWYKG